MGNAGFLIRNCGVLENRGTGVGGHGVCGYGRWRGEVAGKKMREGNRIDIDKWRAVEEGRCFAVNLGDRH